MRIWGDGTEEVRIPHSFRMELDGNSELYVEGCCGIISYKPELVRIELRKLIFSVEGSDLTIENMTGNTIVVRGWIARMAFMN